MGGVNFFRDIFWSKSYQHCQIYTSCPLSSVRIANTNHQSWQDPVETSKHLLKMYESLGVTRISRLPQVVCQASLHEIKSSEEDLRPRKCCKGPPHCQLSSVFTASKYHMSFHGSFLSKTPCKSFLVKVSVSLMSLCQLAGLCLNSKKFPEYCQEFFGVSFYVLVRNDGH